MIHVLPRALIVITLISKLYFTKMNMLMKKSVIMMMMTTMMLLNESLIPLLIIYHIIFTGEVSY